MKKSIIILSGISLIIISIIATLFAENKSNEKDLIFSHKFHIEEAGAECDACHAEAATSTKGTDDLLPKEESCLACHDKEDMGCKACHKSGEKPVLLARIDNYSANFNHSKHIEQGFKCNDCHAGIEKKSATNECRHLPKMAKCMTCHETPEESKGCYLCHNEKEELKPNDHTELWTSNHGSFHESGGNACSACHTESFCTECHLGENLFNESHPPEFILTHSVSYMMRESDCVNCHNGYDFCIDCHTKLNYIRPGDHTPTWGRDHQTQAKTRIDACVVCHSDQDMTCKGCH